MIWQVCVLNKSKERQFQRKPLTVPLDAWEPKEKIVARSYVRADEKAKRNHPNRIVHTYIVQ